MKKYFNILLLVFFINDIGNAQSEMEFAPSGAEWWMDAYSGWGPIGRFGMTYSKVGIDTIIDGTLAREIKRIQFRKTSYSGSYWTIDTVDLSSLYVYDTEDTVFIYNTVFEKFTPLYVFNVDVGDTVCLPVLDHLDLRPNPIANGDTCFCFEIDSIKMVQYGSDSLETVFQHSLGLQGEDDWPIYNWNGTHWSDYLVTGAYARKIGGLYPGFLPNLILPGMEKDERRRNVAPIAYGLRCYVDDDYRIHIPQINNEGCYYNKPTSILDKDSFVNSWNIYPNPASEFLHLDFGSTIPENLSIHIIDLQGKLMKSLKVPKGTVRYQISLHQFHSGIYFIKINDKEHSIHQKLIINKNR